MKLKYWAIFISCALICAISSLRLLNNYELISYDLRFKLRPPLKASTDIVIIEVSDDTLQNLGNWPMPRDFHASIVKVLKELGAKAIVFDILFSEPSPYDSQFADAIKAAGNTYLPVAFNISDRHNPLELAGVDERLKASAKGIGHINVFVDSDGKARRVPLFIKYDNALIPLLGYRVASDWLGEDKVSLPFSKDGALIVNYPDTWTRSFKHLSYFEILKAYADKKEGLPAQLDLSVIKDKACFIGLTATGTSDLRPIPLENVYPMVGLQASVFNSIIQREFITDAGIVRNTLINLLVFILCLAISLRFSPFLAFIGSVGLGLIYFIIATSLFIWRGLWVDLSFPILIIGLTYIGITTLRFFYEARKRQLLEKELDIARAIQKSFLPADINRFDSLSISSFLQPAKFVAGDLYDIFKIDDKKIGVLLGDVSGKGVSASLIMAQTISLFRIFSRQYLDCAQVLSRLNKELYGKFQGRFVTCLYMIIDAREGRVAVASAGQGPLLLHKKSSSLVADLKLDGGLPLGVMEDVEYSNVMFDIESGDKLIVFSDGVTEARNKAKQEFGIANVNGIILNNAHASSQGLLESLKKELFRFSLGAEQHDDITAIVLAKA